MTASFPRTLEACRAQDNNQWAIGDALLAETGDKDVALAECSEFLAEAGLEFQPDTLRGWCRVVKAFPPETRVKGATYTLHKEFAGTDDPPARLREFIAEAETKGIAANANNAGKAHGKADSKPRRAKSSVRASENPPEALRDVVKEFIDDPKFADALANDPSIRKKFDEAHNRRADEVAKKVLKKKGMSTMPTPKVREYSWRDVQETLDHAQNWERTTLELLDKDVHVSLTDDERARWAELARAAIARLTAIIDVAESGTSTTIGDDPFADLQRSEKNR